MTMLTRKQRWRRCHPPLRKNEHSNVFSSPEWKDILPRPPLEPQKSESWSFSPRRNIFSTSRSMSCPELAKKVEFEDNVRVVLIPSHKDYDEIIPLSSIWWTNADYKAFAASALQTYKKYGRLQPIDDDEESTESDAVLL
ncbi:unnamed protein product [Heterosigma akashiwo]|mmetsp:Transcript_18657/g.28187  ORF Transcript_18657/g.28187 Transcript_18657/m.28187 type:complete len:140 (+) Transcript_18657:131-550(+)